MVRRRIAWIGQRACRFERRRDPFVRVEPDNRRIILHRSIVISVTVGVAASKHGVRIDRLGPLRLRHQDDPGAGYDAVHRGRAHLSGDDEGG